MEDFLIRRFKGCFGGSRGATFELGHVSMVTSTHLATLICRGLETVIMFQAAGLVRCSFKEQLWKVVVADFELCRNDLVGDDSGRSVATASQRHTPSMLTKDVLRSIAVTLTSWKIAQVPYLDSASWSWE